MYHGFTDNKVQEGIENYQGKHLSVEKFRSQIRYLKKHYNVISLDQYVESCIKSERLPKNSVVITIDDGYRSNYTLAFPVLKEFDVTATIFLTTDFIENGDFFLWVDRLEYAINHTASNDLKVEIGDEIFPFALNTYKEKIFCDEFIRLKLKSKPIEIIEKTIQAIEDKLNIKLSEIPNIPKIYQPLEWNEILEMIETSNVDIGSHTHQHLILTRYDDDVIQNELSLSKNIIDRKININTRLFCYPNGGIGDFNNKTKQILKELGYSCGLTTVRGINNQGSDIYELKRFGIDNTDLYSFVLTVSGLRYLLYNFKNLIKATF